MAAFCQLAKSKQMVPNLINNAVSASKLARLKLFNDSSLFYGTPQYPGTQ